MLIRPVRLLIGGAVIAIFLGHVAQFWQLPVVGVLEAYLYDIRLRVSTPGTVDERIVIVDIDERSLTEVGRWPWGRDKVAAMVRRLTDEYKVAVVGFDVVFSEPDDSSGLRVLDQIGNRQLRDDRRFHAVLNEIRPGLDYDDVFAATLKTRPVLLGYYFSDQDDSLRLGLLPKSPLPENLFTGPRETLIHWRGYGANLPKLQQAAAGGGHFNPMVDSDGVSRRVPLLVEFGGEVYESLSLAMVRYVLGNARIVPGFPDAESGIEWIDLETGRGRLRIPVDATAAALVPYRGAQHSFTYVSAADVLRGTVKPETLRGKIILVGTTAPGLMDLRATPVGAAYPGVEIHANTIAGIIDGQIRQKPGFIQGVEFVTLLLLGGLLIGFLPILSPAWASTFTVGILGVLAAGDFWLWNHEMIVFPLATSLLLVVSLYAAHMSLGYFFETRLKHRFAELFGQYIPPELVDEMAKDPESYSMEGMNKELTVLFSDVRSFTTLSEGLNPKELAQLMNEYLGAMTKVIRFHRGTLDKYIGDAIMAFWGAPMEDAEHARHAVLTALEMQKAVRTLDEPFKARGWRPLNIGIGVNTGTMTVGDMGSEVRKAYTVMGDAVNLGSRLESLTKHYGVPILVSEDTSRQVKDMAFLEVDLVRVKGKETPVAIFQPLGVTAELPAEILERAKVWREMLKRYRAQDWDGAESILMALREHAALSHLCDVYLERIAGYRVAPPGEDWDGVMTFQVK